MYRKKTLGYFLLFLLVLTGFAGTYNSNTITKEERKSAIKHYKETKKDLLKSVNGLSEAQLNYKPAADKWSIKECMQHIVLAENGLWGMLEGSLATSPNPEKRSEIKMTDDQIMKVFTDRTNKIKTSEPFFPEKSDYQTMKEIVDAFKNHRSIIHDFLKSTNADLRNHVVQLPFGMMDTYQLCLAISAHANRHTQQINEVKASPGFPAK